MFKKIIAGAVALTLLGGGVASAQPYRHQDERTVSRSDHNERYGHDSRYGQNDRYGRNDRTVVTRRVAHDNWSRGQRAPYMYRSSRYAVDYHRYHLRAPPRGYQWVRTGDNRFALVALASGLIFDILGSNY